VKTYLAQRLGIAALTLFGMSLVIFVLLRLAPGDIVDILFSTGGYVNPSERVAIEKELGLDRPLLLDHPHLDVDADAEVVAALVMTMRDVGDYVAGDDPGAERIELAYTLADLGLDQRIGFLAGKCDRHRLPHA